MVEIIYRLLDSIEDFEQVADLEMAIWGSGARDAIPANVMRPLSLNGGFSIGAYDGERMIGMAVAFPALRNNAVFLWSHIAGVLPAYQGMGVGLTLKHQQRDHALALGYEEIRWTFDPLQSRNAWFNIAKLGATSRQYYENFYGAMDDDFNRGLPSDRIEAVWKLHAAPSPFVETDNLPSLIVTEVDNQPVALKPASAPGYRVPVPRDLTGLSTKNRLCWRLALREALCAAFAHDFVVAGFDANCSYLLLPFQDNL